MVDKTAIHLAVRKMNGMASSELKWFRRHSVIEPIIGHTKRVHCMDRTYLKREVGNKIKAILARCGFNPRKLLKAIRLFLLKVRFERVSPA